MPNSSFFLYIKVYIGVVTSHNISTLLHRLLSTSFRFLLLQIFLKRPTMLSQKDYQKPLEEAKENLDFDDREDVLSFCDLPIYSDDKASWDDSSIEDPAFSLDDEAFFEFSSDNLTAKIYPSQNIIFCGKLIPCKEPEKKQTQIHQVNQKHDLGHQKNPKSEMGSNQSSRRKSPKSSKGRISVSKVSILASPTKSSWHILFGLSRIPREMDLSDIKSRQSQRQTRSYDNKAVTSSRSSKSRGLWKMLQVLSCRSYHANTVVKTSLGCVPNIWD